MGLTGLFWTIATVLPGTEVPFVWFFVCLNSNTMLRLLEHKKVMQIDFKQKSHFEYKLKTRLWEHMVSTLLLKRPIKNPTLFLLDSYTGSYVTHVSFWALLLLPSSGCRVEGPHGFLNWPSFLLSLGSFLPSSSSFPTCVGGWVIWLLPSGLVSGFPTSCFFFSLAFFVWKEKNNKTAYSCW